LSFDLRAAIKNVDCLQEIQKDRRLLSGRRVRKIAFQAPLARSAGRAAIGRQVTHPITVMLGKSTRRTMMQVLQNISPCLWFDDQAEEAANYYVAIFKSSKVVNISRYSEAGHELHGKPPGSVMTVAFELDGQKFTALNGGPMFKFSEAISFQVHCDTQEEVDYYWERLSEGGDEKAQQCGWLKDKYGVSWQVVPTVLPLMISDPDSAKSKRAMAAMFAMKKLDIAELQRQYAGIKLV